MADQRAQTIIITGSSRGIGRSMALEFARHGASPVIAAKSADPHPKLLRTILASSKEQTGDSEIPVSTFIDRIYEQLAEMRRHRRIGKGYPALPHILAVLVMPPKMKNA